MHRADHTRSSCVIITRLLIIMYLGIHNNATAPQHTNSRSAAPCCKSQACQGPQIPNISAKRHDDSGSTFWEHTAGTTSITTTTQGTLETGPNQKPEGSKILPCYPILRSRHKCGQQPATVAHGVMTTPKEKKISKISLSLQTVRHMVRINESLFINMQQQIKNK